MFTQRRKGGKDAKKKVVNGRGECHSIFFASLRNQNFTNSNLVRKLRSGLL